MRKITAVALCATTGALVWGLGTIKPSMPEPGIEAKEIAVQEDDAGWDCRTMGNQQCGTVDVKKAEDDAWAYLQKLKPTCKEQGAFAEAWAEVNSQLPGNYEIIGQCVGTLLPGQ